MFIGEFQHSLDSKGRISVPSRFRAGLGTSAVVTKGLDGCLFVYTKTEWDNMARKLSSLPISSSKARAFSRMLLSGAMEVEIDKQGRVLLPAYLRDYAGIEGDVVVAGVFNRVELWNVSAWQNYRATAELESSANVEELSEWQI